MGEKLCPLTELPCSKPQCQNLEDGKPPACIQMTAFLKKELEVCAIKQCIDPSHREVHQNIFVHTVDLIQQKYNLPEATLLLLLNRVNQEFDAQKTKEEFFGSLASQPNHPES